jgi:hypothetical protein
MTVSAFAQDNTAAAGTTASTASAVIPSLINYSGVLKGINGKPLTSITGVTFLLYKEEQGGAPLWIETQNITPDKTGKYGVTLGATKLDSSLSDSFANSEARWLGVQITGQAEQSRVLLVSVPYAMKAADADTIGGLPVSAFMLANGTNATSAASSSAATGKSLVSASTSAPPANPNVTGKGLLNFIPMWDSTSDIVDSVMFQQGSKIGINTTVPAATLDVSGKTDVRDTLTLFPKATDPTLAVSGTSFKVDSTGKVTFISGQTFPGTGTITGVTTAGGSGLSGGGTSGTLSLKVPAAGITNAMLQNSKVTLNSSAAGGLTVPGAMSLGGTYTIGLKTCSANQILQYSGTAWTCKTLGTGTGTVTSVGSGAGLTGGPITSSGTLSIATGGVLNSMLQNSQVTVNAGADLTGGGAVSLGGSTTLNLDTTKVPLLAAANTFNASQSVVGSIFPDVTGANNSSFTPGVIFGGTGGGESIASNRANSFFNQFGLDFYTNFAARMSIYQDGTIGMGASILKFGGTQVFIDPPAGDNSNAGLIALGQETFDAGFSGGDGIHGSGGSGSSGGFDGTGGVFFGGCCAGFGDGMVVWPGSGIAAFFEGDVSVFGNLSKSSGSFKIDHPLDPANKYLYHSFVESPDMKNIYDGVVTLDGNGEAAVQLPDWFDALNRDFRYQLTSMGAPGPNLYISQEVSGNHFAIAGGKPGMKVSWQVTGTRQDAWANAHRIPVEEEKSPQERGYYIAPELFGQTAEKQITYARHPEMLRKHKVVQEQSRNAARALQQHQQQGPHLERLARPAVQPSGSPNP